MEERKDILKELKEIAPEFPKIKKENPFQVPENYFNDLPDRVLSQLPNEESGQGLIDQLDRLVKDWLNLIFQPKYAIPMASVLLIMIICVNLYKGYIVANEDPLSQIADISTADIQDYILEYYEVEDLISMNLQLEQSITEDINSYNLPEDVSIEDLNNYIYQNIDEQILKEELL